MSNLEIRFPCPFALANVITIFLKKYYYLLDFADDETRYRMSQIYSQEPAEAKFPLTNGSLFVHLMNPTSADGKRGECVRSIATL